MNTTKIAFQHLNFFLLPGAEDAQQRSELCNNSQCRHRPVQNTYKWGENKEEFKLSLTEAQLAVDLENIHTNISCPSQHWLFICGAFLHFVVHSHPLHSLCCGHTPCSQAIRSIFVVRYKKQKPTENLESNFFF